MRALTAALAAASLLALLPAAEAIHKTGEDRDLATHYSVQGRVVNETGWPVEAVEVQGTLLGYTAIDRTNCAGDFHLPIPTFRTLSPYDEIKVVAKSTTQTLKVDPHTRRSDTKFTVDGTVSGRCERDREVEPWLYQYTVEGRIVERIADLEGPGGTLFARPIQQKGVRLFMSASWTNETGVARSADFESKGAGGLPPTDASGNFRFNFLIADELDGGFRVSPQNVSKINASFEGRVVDVPLDFHTRYSYVAIILGDVPQNGTPAPAAAAAAGVVVCAAAIAGRRRA